MAEWMRIGAVVAATLLVAGCSGGDIQSSASPSPSASASATASASPSASEWQPGTVSPSPEPTPEPEPTEEATEAAEPTGESDAEVPAQTVADPANVTVVVNKLRPLPADFAPELVHVGIPSYGEQYLHPAASAALTQLDAAMRADLGTGIVACSAYRSYDTQVSTYNYWVGTYGQEHADRISARPGHSEHQTGLAVDVMGDGQGCDLYEWFGESDPGRWMQQHAHEYGFILRYPAGSEGAVGYLYEPWHWRYVGVETATDFKNSGEPIFEYYMGLPAAPTYG